MRLTPKLIFFPVGGGGLRIARSVTLFRVGGGSGLGMARNVTLFLVAGGSRVGMAAGGGRRYDKGSLISPSRKQPSPLFWRVGLHIEWSQHSSL
jgi:hypothetical protein